MPVRGELVPGPGRFEIEVLDADPRRVKKLKIYLGTDRLNGSSRDATRRVGTAQPAADGNAERADARSPGHPRCVGEAFT